MCGTLFDCVLIGFYAIFNSINIELVRKRGEQERFSPLQFSIRRKWYTDTP